MLNPFRVPAASFTGLGMRASHGWSKPQGGRSVPAQRAAVSPVGYLNPACLSGWSQTTVSPAARASTRKNENGEFR
jgi:hypothetical protein